MPPKILIWRPRRDLNPCYRRERTTTIRKYNDLQEAGGHLSPCESVQANTFTYRNPYRENKPQSSQQVSSSGQKNLLPAHWGSGFQADECCCLPRLSVGVRLRWMLRQSSLPSRAACLLKVWRESQPESPIFKSSSFAVDPFPTNFVSGVTITVFIVSSVVFAPIDSASILVLGSPVVRRESAGRRGLRSYESTHSSPAQ